MADYDGPTYTISPGTFRETNYERDNHFVVPFTFPTVVVPAPFMGGGSSGTPSGQDINGYGYSHSG